AATVPTATNATRIERWTNTSAGAISGTPRTSARDSTTPCQSGDSQTTAWRNVGSVSIGKKTPENRNSGVMMNRKITLNRAGVRWVAENAAIGAANDMPVSTAIGTPSTIAGEAAAPRMTTMTAKTVEIIASRHGVQSRLPRAMSRGDSGVAYIAWNVRCQLSPPMIGNVASNAADCIDVATSRPGARNCRYE